MPAIWNKAIRAAGIAGILVWQAAAQDASPGAVIRFHNWWNYYERALGFMNEGKYAEARDDLQRALGVMPGAKFGRDEDVWRARTYGLHFVEGYFPNRELGIALFRLGDLDAARERLEKSLTETPSGRAKHYLNLIRRQQTRADAAPPAINVTDESAVTLTSLRTRELSGVVKGEGLIAALSINGRPDFIELAEPGRVFQRDIDLAPGTNRIEIAAADLRGQQASSVVTWVADWTPPCFLVRAASREDDGWILSGLCADQYGLRSVTVNGKPAFTGAPGDERKEVTVEAHMDNLVPCTIEAEDLAGNRFRGVVDFESLQQVAAASRAPTVWASAEPAGRLDAPAGSVPAAAPPRDAQRPALRFTSPATEDSVVWRNECYLDGWAEDRALASVTVNGEELLPAQLGGAIGARFSRWLPLDPGTNEFEVVATDASGNRTVRRLHVVRQKPEFLEDDMRLSVGLPPPTQSDDPDLAGQVARLAAGEVTRNPVRFQLLERDEGWDFILREQNLSLSDLADARAAIPIGKMLPADMLILLEILHRDQGAEIYARVVETSEGQILCVEDVYDTGDRDSLPRQVAGLMLKIEQRFPVMAADVTKVGGGRVTMNVGSRDGVLAGSKFVVLDSDGDAGNGNDPGTVRRVDGKPIELIAQRVRDADTVARVFPSDARTEVRVGDRVYAR